MATLTRVQKWGNSLAVRLPKEITRDLTIDEGSTVQVEQGANMLTIKLSQAKKAKLSDLIKLITTANLHSEFDWGQPVGKEVW